MSTYYIATTGSDSNPGSSGSPWLTLQKAANTAIAGDTINVANGTYGVPAGVGTSGWACNISSAGTSLAPITLQAATRGGVVLDCGLACHSYIQFQNGSAYWKVIGFRIQHGIHAGIWCNNGSGSSDHISIEQCEIDHIANIFDATTFGNCGIYTDGFATNWLVDSCLFHDVGRTNDPGNSYDHSIYTHCPSLTVQNCIFYNALAGWHITTADGSGGTIINNTFFGPNLYSGSGGTKGGSIIIWCPTNTSTWTFRNNIFYSPNFSGLATSPYGLSGVPGLTSSLCDHNIVYSPTNGAMTMFDSTPSGITVASNTLNVDPTLVNPVQGGDYNLQTGSIAIGAGSTTLEPAADYAGNSRSGSPDIGAYEYVGGGAVATHLVYSVVPTTGTVGAPFSVTVQAQTVGGSPASPTSNTTITLSVASGGGTLSGTLTGVITTSNTSVTISTPKYSAAGTMTLTATATAGETSLTAVTSGNIVFAIGSGILKVGGVRVIPDTNGSQTNTLDLASRSNAHAIRLKAPDVVPADVVIVTGQIYFAYGLEGLPVNGQGVLFPAIVAGNFPANFAGSFGSVGVNPSSSSVYTINKNGSAIGTITISTGGSLTFATTGSSAQAFSVGDRLEFLAPAIADATLAGVVFALIAART